MKLLLGDDERVAAWVAERIGLDGFGPCTAIGVISDSGEAVAGCVYHDYQPRFGTIQMSCAAESPRWAAKGVIRGLLAYPFDQLGCRLAWLATPHRNERTIRFVKGIGFIPEAVLRDRFGKGSHAAIFRMLKTDFLKRYENGQVRTVSASRA